MTHDSADPTRAPQPTPAEWQDWRWQLTHRVTTVAQLRQYVDLTQEEEAGIRATEPLFQWGITPYYAALMDRTDRACPIRQLAVPHGAEAADREGLLDPLQEEHNSPIQDLIHVYPDRIAFCVTTACQVYCRHCFRKRRTMPDYAAQQGQLDRAIDYIAQHQEIRDVLVTGGDPLAMSDEAICGILARLRAIPHVEILRVGTRAPVTCPMRITPALVEKLKPFQPLWINTHFNHPKEFTPESDRALARLADGGFPLGNQSVFLKGINDSVEMMRALVHGLVKRRVRPYYIFHPQRELGTAHFWIPVARGLEIHEALEGFTSGLAVPLYILDTPYGKVPLARSRLVSLDKGSFTVRCFRGQLWTEPDSDE